MAKKKFNYETASEVAKMRQLTANQRIAATQTQQYAQGLAQNVQSLGQSAAGGGQYYDTSAREGFQNPETGAYSGMLKRTITRPINRMSRDVGFLARLRAGKRYRAGLKSIDNKSGIYSGGTGGTNPTDQTSYQYSGSIL